MKNFDKKRADIKEASIKMFTRYGMQKTTLEDIAGSLGLKKNSLYYYYESKEALVHEILLDKINNHMDIAAEVVKKNITSREKVLLLIESFYSFISNYIIKYSFTISSILEIAKYIRESFPEFQMKQGKYFKQLLDEGVENGEFIKINTKVISKDIEFLTSALFSHNLMECGDDFFSDSGFEMLNKDAIRIVSYLLDGISANR